MDAKARFPLWFLSWLLAVSWAGAQQPTSCDRDLPPPRSVLGQQVGPSSCLMLERMIRWEEADWVRLDLGISGRVEGYLPKTGYYINYFTSAPDLVFPQGSNPGPIYLGVGEYRRETGHGMVLLYPAQGWNGKLWVTVHGRGRSFKRGNMKPWDQNFDPQDPVGDLDRFEHLMLRKGYAVAKTRRTSDTLGGELQVRLEDGTFYPEKNLNDNARFILDFTLLAERVLERRLGRAPTRTYLYGHSAGGRIGRAVNYVPGLNRDGAGQPIVDGILADDSATGLWLPVVVRDGRDVLFSSPQEREAFVPQLEVIHQMYNRETPGERPAWVSTNYLQNKRRNALILRDKGLGHRHRMYEIRSLSHSGGENRPAGDPDILDLALMMDRFIDILDSWVEQGVQPPPNRSDWPPLGDLDGDGVIEHPALAFPEVACPLGVYHQYPPAGGGPGVTFFTPFDGKGLEPLDGRGRFVDMNCNGVRDHRERVSQAWRRLGLLDPGEKLTRERYVACVERAARQLAEEGFFSQETAARYVEKARQADFQP